jgi:transcriptional regulator with XRE-family HTH domain
MLIMGGQEIRDILAKNIKSFRNHRQWSQADLAYKADISIPFLSDIERGNKWPYPDTLSKLAKALEVEVHEFFRKEEGAARETQDTVARVVKEILVAQKTAADKICKQYLG